MYILCNRYKNCKFIIEDKAKYGDFLTVPNLYFSYFFMILKRFSNYMQKRSPIKRIGSYLIFKCLSLYYGHKNTMVYIVGNTFKNYNYIGKQQIQWLKNLVSLSSDFYLISSNYGPCNDNRWIKDCSEVIESMTDVCFCSLIISRGYYL